MDTESLVMKLTGAAHHIQMDLDDGCSNPVFWLGLQKMLSEAAGTIEVLRQRVQELEQQARERALQDLSNSTQEFMAYDQLQECQAREAKLREALSDCVDYWVPTNGNLEEEDRQIGMYCQALALPNDDSALKEYRRKVLLEAADSDWCDSRHSGELRRMAEK